jgi:hypothetical protein
MENNLLRVVKSRIMDELTGSIQRNQVYMDKVQVFHKFPYKERLMMAVILKNASSSRIKLSADDHAGVLKSHVMMAHAENFEGKFLTWVWEDFNNLTGYQENEDLSSQITGTSLRGTNRFFKIPRKPILSGYNNTIVADNFRQISVLLDGQSVLPEFLDGASGVFSLPMAPVLGSQLLVSYYYGNLTPPGRYYIEIISPSQFVIDPFYVIKTEKVIDRTMGTELTAQLLNGNLYGDFDILYTKKMDASTKLYLEKNTDYTIDQNGLITFLQPLDINTTLYANYRWVGDTMGPFNIPSEFHYVNEALPGVILSFGNEITVGDKVVVIVYPQREAAANMNSGHYKMSFEIDVVARDPKQLADLTDHLIEDIWGNRRLLLIDEGLTIEEMDATGESEEPYDENTGDLYYHHGINIQIMTEWKKFIPFLTEIVDFDTKVYRYVTKKEYIVTNQGRILELMLKPSRTIFEVSYPKIGYPRYF